jgi:hypothetical protein
LRRSHLDLNTLPLQVAKLGESLAKRPERLWATNEKKTDAPHAIYCLGAHCHGRSRSTAKKHDDIAASQLNELHWIFAPFELIEPHSVSRSLNRICRISNWYGSVRGGHPAHHEQTIAEAGQPQAARFSPTVISLQGAA